MTVNPMARVQFQGSGPIMCILSRAISVLSLCCAFGGIVLGQGGTTGKPTVVINEFMAQNVGSLQDPHGDFDDWIELYNYGDNAVNLAGCYLSDELTDPTKWRIPAGDPAVTTIPAHGFLLIWADQEGSQGLLHANFKLSAGGESIGLYDAQGSLLDSLTFGAQTVDVSCGRLPDGTGQWQPLAGPTPGAPNQGVSADIVITEIMYHPPHADTSPEDVRLEWIELLNAGTGPVNLAGWRLTDGVDYLFPEVVLKAGDRLVVAADANAFSAKHPDVANVVGGWTGWLSNSGERVALTDSVGTVVDAVRYADGGDWSVRELGPLDYYQRGWQWSDAHDGGGKSLELLNPAMPNEFGQNWAASLVDGGTPGQPNPLPTHNIAPMILHVRHAPVIPGPGDAVAVTARIVDEQTTGLKVTLHYRLDHSTYTDQSVYPQAEPASYDVQPMFDDGAHDDGQANDGLFGAVIPAQQNGRIVEFYVAAEDSGGNSRTWPAPSLIDGVPQQVTNALYQVDGTFDPAAPWSPESLPVYYLIMTEAERARLEDIGNAAGGPGTEDERNSNAQMNGTFISVDGTGVELRYNVGIRNRGKGSRTNSSGNYRNNYRVNFPTDTRWKELTATNVKARFGYVAVLGSAVWRMANLPAERITPIRVFVNGRNWAFEDRRMFGAYATVEVMDDEFAKRHFPSDREGNLYRCANDRADLVYLGTNPANYRAGYEKQTNSAANDYRDIINLTNVLNNTPTDRLVEEARKVIRLDQWLRYLAVDALCGNREGGLTVGRGDDYAVYAGVLDTRFWLIPHDLDTLFGQGDNSADINRDIHVYSGLAGLRKLLTQPEVLALYHAQLIELIDTVFSPEQFNPLVDQVLDSVPEATRESIKQFVVQRNAAVLAQIPQNLTVNSGLTAVNGYLQTTSDKYTLSGTANAATTRSVLVNGVPASWSAQDGTWQSAGSFAVAESLVSAGSEWKYLDDGSDQGTTWRGSGFDDSTWRAGKAQLGYGDNDEATVINSGPSSGRFITAYFRKSFMVRTLADYYALHIRVLRDDGAVVYLNGVEAWRINMPQGDIRYTTLASSGVSGTDESTFLEQDLPLNLLRQGVNVLAVEVHQNAQSSSDTSFDLELQAMRPSVLKGTLLPGITRVVVEAFDAQYGTGNKVEEKQVSIWYEDGDMSPLSGTITADRTLQAADGPWHVTSTVTVPAGVTLTIGPGATLFFDPGTSLVVNGRLIAEGTPYERISLTKMPGSTSWAGLQFKNAKQESRLAYVTMEYCDSGSAAIVADHAKVAMDHIIWTAHTKMYLSFDDSSMILKNSILPSIQSQELVHFWGMPADGYALIEGNWFGTTSGYNDVIDFTGGQRPGPIGRFINNTFSGASDDGIDLDAADAHVEGNVFMHMHQDAPRDTLSHAVTTGTEYGEYSRVTAVRNLFYDVDHAFLSKDDGFVTAVSNTVVHATRAVANMYEARSGQWQGKGFYGDGNIFHDVAHLFANPDWAGHPTAITMNNSIFPVIEGDPLVWDGSGDLENADPLLVRDVNITDPSRDMRLLPSSPAIGTGANGRDMGGVVPGGASISGEPGPVTWRTNVSLTVGGPDIYAYKYRVNDGPWSGEVLRPEALLAGNPKPLPPITLANLQDGQSYTVCVVGKDSAGVWQSEDSPTASRTFAVDTAYRQLVINEIMAVNETEFDHGGTFPDMVELYYDGPGSLSLTGISLSDDSRTPDKYVFPAGVMMNAGEYLVLFADDNTGTSGLHLGFAFDAQGEALYLYDKTGALIDSVEFGAQLPDMSIGRVGATGQWRLTVPSFGQANLPMPLGDPRAVKINEWLATGEVLFPTDFAELYNPSPLPVDLGGFYISDAPETEPARCRLAPLTFIAGEGYLVFAADDRTDPGHLGFRLSEAGDRIALFDAAFQQIDSVVFHSQTIDISQGRSPDGSDRFDYFVLPTPGLPNMAPPQELVNSVSLVPESAAKSAIVPTSAGEVADTWKSDLGFDDSSWLHSSGAPGGVGYERSSGYGNMISINVQTQMYSKNGTCYVRIPFHVDAAVKNTLSELHLSVRYDDGYVAYLNGVEVGRVGFTGTPTWNSRANASHEADAQAFDVVLDLSANLETLREGDNLLAIQALNDSTTSSDFIISATLTGIARKLEENGEYLYTEQLKLLQGLRVTELMYNDPKGDNLDYIELRNIADQSLDLTGVRFTGGVDFTFPQMQLAPTEYVVVVRDLVAFQASYGSDVRVAGQFDGHLSDNGEEVVLQLPAPLDVAILRFRYRDDWHPATDGGGESLTIQDPTAAPVTWSDRDSWTPASPTPGKP